MTHEIDNILLAKLLAPVHQEKDAPRVRIVVAPI